ncbi:MAG: hypothetical protein SGARI_005491 [Bacillariaceae sp.]
MNASTALQLPTTEMLSSLQSMTTAEDRFDELLTGMGIQYLAVEYERLYYNYYAPQEWARIFEHLGRGPASNLTLQKLEKASALAPTHSAPTQKVTLSNFEQVVGILEGTDFEHLLH